MPSTVIKTFSYSNGSSTLRITFVSGMIYDYHGVPQDLFDQFKSASSKGIFFNECIKGLYPFTKVN